MTTTTDAITAPARSGLVSRPLLLRSVSIFGTSVGFYLPLSVVPLLAKQGGAHGGAGLGTVALLLATVAGELVTPRLTARIGYRWALALGLTLLGGPTLVLAADGGQYTIIGVSIVRGLGFAICTVAGGALNAAIMPAERRGEGLAVVGLVSGVSSLLALPAGVWVAAQWGFGPVFVATAVITLLSLLSLLSVPGLPDRAALAGAHEHRGLLAGLRRPAFNRPATIFAASTAAVGVLVTFLPLAIADRPAWVAAAALLAQPGAATAARWVAGRLGDRRGPARLLVPGLALAAAGMAAMALTGSAVAVIGGALVFGAGFGVLQNATLVLMYNRAPVGGELTVSAIWNTAYDLGMAGGALLAGLLVTTAGYPLTFLLTAAAMVPALALAVKER
ncbi:MFS transporter [Dactylosporangium sp. NPDC051485]|uniref:MFS transporter n=1 Tax=Dactylosporangium sp. NPDC051485 TaxID=3154846 RepID=UPI003445FE68